MACKLVPPGPCLLPEPLTVLLPFLCSALESKLVSFLFFPPQGLCTDCFFCLECSFLTVLIRPIYSLFRSLLEFPFKEVFLGYQMKMISSIIFSNCIFSISFPILFKKLLLTCTISCLMSIFASNCVSRDHDQGCLPLCSLWLAQCLAHS